MHSKNTWNTIISVSLAFHADQHDLMDWTEADIQHVHRQIPHINRPFWAHSIHPWTKLTFPQKEKKKKKKNNNNNKKMAIFYELGVETSEVNILLISRALHEYMYVKIPPVQIITGNTLPIDQREEYLKSYTKDFSSSAAVWNETWHWMTANRNYFLTNSFTLHWGWEQ